jgi:hypothetical protein
VAIRLDSEAAQSACELFMSVASSLGVAEPLRVEAITATFSVCSAGANAVTAIKVLGLLTTRVQSSSSEVTGRLITEIVKNFAQHPEPTILQALPQCMRQWCANQDDWRPWASEELFSAAAAPSSPTRQESAINAFAECLKHVLDIVIQRGCAAPAHALPLLRSLDTLIAAGVITPAAELADQLLAASTMDVAFAAALYGLASLSAHASELSQNAFVEKALGCCRADPSPALACALLGALAKLLVSSASARRVFQAMPKDVFLDLPSRRELRDWGAKCASEGISVADTFASLLGSLQ